MDVSFLEELLPYTVLLFNTAVFAVLRKLLFPATPKRWYLVVSEVIATWELCADVAELGVVYERHGTILYALALLLCCVWWCRVFGDAEACPCGPVEDMLFHVGTGDYRARLLGQVVGAVLTRLYIQAVWSLKLISEHEVLATVECQTSLAVTTTKGAIIEGFITCISRFMAMRSIYWTPNMSIAINSITTVVLVLAALTTTGGYFNPIMASALMLGCEGGTLTDHFLVYWLGALLGGFFGHYLHFRLEIAIKEKYA